MKLYRLVTLSLAVFTASAVYADSQDATSRAFNAAVDACWSQLMTSRAGNCVIEKISSLQPDWTSHPQAPRVVKIAEYLNHVGARLSTGELTEQQFKDNLNMFISRLNIEEAQQQRAQAADDARQREANRQEAMRGLERYIADQNRQTEALNARSAGQAQRQQSINCFSQPALGGGAWTSCK